MVKFYDEFNPPPGPVLDCPERVTTKQEFKAECDINTLMARYRSTGILPPGRQVSYGDFSEVGDYHAAQQVLVTAREQFEGLPSEVRERFRNDPARFLEFISEKGNRKAMAELGLLSPQAVADLVAAEAKAKEAADQAAVAKAAAEAAARGSAK